MTNITEELMEQLFYEFKSFYPSERFHYLQFGDKYVDEWVKGETEPIKTNLMQKSVAEALGIDGGIDSNTSMVSVTYTGDYINITHYTKGKMQIDYTWREKGLK